MKTTASLLTLPGGGDAGKGWYEDTGGIEWGRVEGK